MMRHLFLLSLVVASAASLPADGNPANEKPPEPSPTLGFDFKKVQPPDAEKETPVARLFYDYIYPTDVMADSTKLNKAAADRLNGMIFGRLRQRYQEEHRFVATSDEIKQFADAMSKGRGKDAAGFEGIGKKFVENWKIDRSLYETYGGTVIFQQANPMEPVGAYRKFLEEMETAKVFEVYDEANRKQFWHYFVREHPLQMKEEPDFDTPWWLKKKPE